MTNDLQTTSININQNQLLAAQLLAAGKSGKAVAAEVGVSEETISRWKQDEDFKIYMMELIVEAHEAARARLQNIVSKAVDNIATVLNEPSLRAKDKFVISVKVLELCNSYYWVTKDAIKLTKNPPLEFGF